MNRNDDIESLLSPWMSRQDRRAPDDLLLRVMNEVETMSQESTAIRMGILRSSLVGWVVGGLAVITMAVVAGLLIVNLRATPAGAPGSPSPTAITPALGTVRERDPLGDATGNAPDIVAVNHTRVSANLFILEIELAEPMVSGEQLHVVLETNGGGPYQGNRPIPMEGGPETCYGWFMEEAVTIGPDGIGRSGGIWQPSTAMSGTRVSIDIPLQEIGVTEWLAFYVVTRTDNEGPDNMGADWFPGELDGCYPLIWPVDASESE